MPGGTVDLEFRGLTKSFEHGPVADFSLSVEAGELRSLRWSSGYGKARTLRIGAGFASPDAGRVFVKGVT